MRITANLMVLALSLFTVVKECTCGGNFRIFPGTVTQTEPVVAVHPVNPHIMFASAVTINTSNGFKSEGVYV